MASCLAYGCNAAFCLLMDLGQLKIVFKTKGVQSGLPQVKRYLGVSYAPLVKDNGWLCGNDIGRKTNFARFHSLSSCCVPILRRLLYSFSTMESKERRLQPRYFLQIQAKMSTVDGAVGTKTTQEVIATNISSGGAFLETDAQLPLASKIYLEFLIDYEHLKKLRFVLSFDSLKKFTGKKVWVKAAGVIIRQEKNGLGVIFEQDYQLSPM